MRRTRGLFQAILATTVLCATAWGQVVFDFEGPDYTTGSIVGQDGWVASLEEGSATIVTADNGPSIGGSQCLELSDAGGSLAIERTFPDQVGTLPKLVTYSMDYRIMPGSSCYYCYPRIPGARIGFWHYAWAQWTGAYNPDGTNWSGNWGTTGWEAEVWHTHTWTLLYSEHDGGKGQLLSYAIDGNAEVRYADQQCYLRHDESTVLDRVHIEFNNAWDEANDTLHIDNITVTVEDPPSAIPVADAGADLSGQPGSAVTLDASGSSDDGGIVRYRWVTGDQWGSVLYDGPDAMPTVNVPAGSYTVMLEVFDADGLRDTDFADFSFEMPAVNPLVFDFEPESGYVTGPLAGQDAWVMTQSNGAATVVDTDNGPALGGNQCLLLDNDDGTGQELGGILQVERACADLLALGGGYVTVQFDLRRVEVPDAPHIQRTNLVLPGTTLSNWADTWANWQGARYPWGGGWNEDRWNWGGQGNWDWHTHKWVLVYSDHDGGPGQILTYQVDDREPIDLTEPQDQQYPACYLRDSFGGALDILKLYMEPMWWGDHNASYIAIDNLIVEAAPLPSAPPVADAGGPYLQDPGQWEGVELDASASTDDGAIVRYRWTFGHGGGVIYDGPDPTPLVDLGPGTYDDIVLMVYDDTGLIDTVSTSAVIGERPPILDDVAGPWGILNGNIYGTNASDEIPVQIDATKELTLLNQVTVPGAQPAEHVGSAVVDQFGNLYFFQRNSQLLLSYTPQLDYRWTGHYPGGGDVHMGSWWATNVGNTTVIAGMRYVYVIGAAVDHDPDVYPHVYAYEKSTGELAWETELSQEDWSNVDGAVPGAPAMTLYADKLYIRGLVSGPGIDLVNIYQLDASTGAIDWWQTVTVELDWDPSTPPIGRCSITLIPDPYGDGKHYLVFNELSDSEYPMDGYNDIACVEIDPIAGTATNMYAPGGGGGTDGPMLQRSFPLYSSLTGLIYTPSSQGGDYGGPHAMYAWHPLTGLADTYTVSPPEPADAHIPHGEALAFALDFDGRTVHATGEGATVRSYTDNGDGTWDYVYREFTGDLGFGFRLQGALLQDDNGHSIFITGTRSECCGGAAGHMQVVALDLTGTSGTGLAPLSVVDLPTEDYVGWYNFGPIPGPDGTFYLMSHRWDQTVIWHIGVTEAEMGACCYPDTSCAQAYEYDCVSAGGVYMGNGMTCDQTTCAGACCQPSGICAEMSESQCESAGGVYAGLDTSCANAVCDAGEACIDAVMLPVPALALNDTTLATIDQVTAEGCGAADSDGPDLWYKVTGTGYTMTASLCASPLVWDSQIAVYEGSDCGSLVCVGWGDDTCCPGSWGCHGDLTWGSTAGTTYYIRVFGWDYQAGVYGPFALVVEDDAPTSCPGDSNCDGAINWRDIDFFVASQNDNVAAWEALHMSVYGHAPTCPFENNDVDGSGSANWRDIDPFVAVQNTTCP